MTSKILILTFVAFYQVVNAQIPIGFPNPLGTGMTPPFFGTVNNNWMRPFYTAAAEGWRTYFEQINQARHQLFNTLNNNPTQNGNLKPPKVEAPVQQEVVTTVIRPQAQADVQPARPQTPVSVGLSGSGSGQAAGRQPAVAIPPVASGARPTVNSVVPQVSSQIVPPVQNWVGK